MVYFPTLALFFNVYAPLVGNMIESSNSCTQGLVNLVQDQVKERISLCTQSLLDHAEEIDLINSLWADEQSRDFYQKQLAHVATREVIPEVSELFNPLPLTEYVNIVQQASKYFAENPPPELKFSFEKDKRAISMVLVENFFLNGYEYKDQVKVQEGDIFLDCGAFVGDTAIWAYQKGAAQVYSFEPLPDLFPDLSFNLKLHNHPLKNIVPCALSDTNGTAQFVVTTHNAGASLLNARDYGPNLDLKKSHLQNVRTIRLDDWCAENNVEPTFIKMDIEGAELSALKGCAETIKRLKPKLAICLYHKFEDMWEIPSYIHSIVPEYKFFCKKNHNVCDFIMYATAD